MIAFTCLACRRDRLIGEGSGSIGCACGRSWATFDDDRVELHGPCTATRVGQRAEVRSIRRKPVPALL